MCLKTYSFDLLTVELIQQVTEEHGDTIEDPSHGKYVIGSGCTISNSRKLF